jgi:predicted transcriptional regulator
MRARELKKARARLGLTQVALAKALDVHRTVVARYETSVMPIPRTVELAVQYLLVTKDS